MPRPHLPGLVRRRLEAVVAARLEEEPVIVLQGPRSVGKSTLLAQVASARGVEVVDLDDPSVQAAVRGNLNGFLATPPTVCIDKHRKVPELLDAIKARLNRSSRPGSIVLTGSTRYQALPLAAQSLTGRMHVITVRPLSQGEISGKRETFLETLVRDADQAIEVASRAARSRTSRADYIVGVIPSPRNPHHFAPDPRMSCQSAGG